MKQNILVLQDATSHGGGGRKAREKMQGLSSWVKEQLENWQELKASFS